MKTYVLTLGLVTGLLQSALAQQPTGTPDENRRRFRRVETRTTTTKLYPERDSILAILQRRMTLLNQRGGGGNPASYFTETARITDTDGIAKSPAEYQSMRDGLKFWNYKVRKLEINEGTAKAVEEYDFAPPAGSSSTTPPDQKATVTSELRKGADGQWRITQMRVAAGK
ncbi:hypothetical protein [Larkinella soli]|uniref:hypothetical protein n=1 Tax=Larkinella soli TaxID=1770527 RepID=UPI000FFC9497|nr:hypothetical protein [Larkinella soli]